MEKLLKLTTFISLLTLLSCGESRKTNLSLTIGFSSGVAPEMVNQTIVYAKRKGDDLRAAKIIDSEILEEDLDNGEWDIVAFYYAGVENSNELTDDLRCGHLNLILNGGLVEKSLNLSSDNCRSHPFVGGEGSVGVVKNLKFKICNQGTSVDYCSPVAPTMIKGVRVALNSYKLTPFVSEGTIEPFIISKCIDVFNSITASQFSTGIKIPTGSPLETPYVVSIETFSDSGCNTSNGLFNIREGFDNIDTGTLGSDFFKVDNTGSDDVYFYFQQHNA